MFNKTVDDVVKSLTKMVNDLDVVLNTATDARDKHAKLAKEAGDEAVRAAKIKLRLAALISD